MLTKKRRYIILSIIIALLIHAAFLYFLATYTPSHNFIAFPERDAETYIVIPLDDDSNTQPTTLDENNKQDEPSVQESQQPTLQPRPPSKEPVVINAFSSKEAEIMDGKAITQEQTGQAQWAPNVFQDGPEEQPSIENDDSLPETDQPLNTLDDEPGQDDETYANDDEIGDEPGDAHGGDEGQTPGTDQSEPEQPEIPLSTKQPEKKESTTFATSLNKPIISRRSQEQARKKLAAFSQGFNKQFAKNSKEKAKNAGRVRIAQHQSELQTMSYRQKINQAIYAAALQAPSVYADHTIAERIKCVITLNADGKVMQIDFPLKTSLSTINDYIRHLIEIAEFPPLPKHLNLQSYSHVFDPMVRIAKGRYQLRYSYKE